MPYLRASQLLAAIPCYLQPSALSRKAIHVQPLAHWLDGDAAHWPCSWDGRTVRDLPRYRLPSKDFPQWSQSFCNALQQLSNRPAPVLFVPPSTIG